MTEGLVAVCLILGSAWLLLAALGALRMPDLPMRMHATTKAGALGCGLIMVGVAFFFAEAAVTTRSIAIIAFIMLTAPVAAHVVARAAYFVGVPLWHKIVRDDLRDQNPSTRPESPPSAPDKPDPGSPRE